MKKNLGPGKEAEVVGGYFHFYCHSNPPTAKLEKKHLKRNKMRKSFNRISFLHLCIEGDWER
jgi:hypothetical protein